MTVLQLRCLHSAHVDCQGAEPMTTRGAACSCGQLHLAIEGEPSRISMCHCLGCQRRTGAVISNQARFHRKQVSPSAVRLRRGGGSTSHIVLNSAIVGGFLPSPAGMTVLGTSARA